jgi:propanediol dehydratase large subunit
MKSILLCCAIAVACSAPALADSNGVAATEVLDLERASMDGWLKGDPDPSLAVADPKITFIHSVVAQRLEGLDAVRALFEQYRGTPLFDSYEMSDPKVQVAGDVAVVSYVLVRHNGDAVSRWNGTQVYERKANGWRVIHAHWSAEQP